MFDSKRQRTARLRMFARSTRVGVTPAMFTEVVQVTNGHVKREGQSGLVACTCQHPRRRISLARASPGTSMQKRRAESKVSSWVLGLGLRLLAVRLAAIWIWGKDSQVGVQYHPAADGFSWPTVAGARSLTRGGVERLPQRPPLGDFPIRRPWFIERLALRSRFDQRQLSQGRRSSGYRVPEHVRVPVQPAVPDDRPPSNKPGQQLS